MGMAFRWLLCLQLRPRCSLAHLPDTVSHCLHYSIDYVTIGSMSFYDDTCCEELAPQEQKRRARVKTDLLLLQAGILNNKILQLDHTHYCAMAFDKPAIEREIETLKKRVSQLRKEAGCD